MDPNNHAANRLEFARFMCAQIDKEYRVHQEAHGTCRTALAELESNMCSFVDMGELSENDRKQMGRWQTERTKLLGKLRRLEEVLQSEDTKRKIHLSSLMAQYDAILALPRAFSLSVVEGCAVLETQTLYGKNEPGDWRVIGEFRLAYIPAESELTKKLLWTNRRGVWSVKNKNNPNGELVEVMTPTGVGKDGKRSCVGNARNVFMDAIARHDCVTIFATMIRFAECPGEFYGRLIEYWPKVPLEEVPPWYRQQFGD